jgi:YD repeat-containing protein
LPVYAFSGTVYAGYNKTTDASGWATFTLPFGDYRFRADKNGTQFWSDTENHCTLPGCTNAVITTTVQAGLLGRGKTFAAPLPWSWNVAPQPDMAAPVPLRDSSSGDLVTRTITYTYDPLNRLTGATYSTGEAYAYAYDAVGNRTAMTSTTPLSGTVVTTYTYDVANRLTDRGVSDGRVYTYTWSQRGQMLAEYTQGYPVRTFTHDAAGQLVRATVFTLTTEFVYNGLGARVAVSVAGQTTSYVLDYAAGNRILVESTPTSTVRYLYGETCLGEERDAIWLHYLPDAEGYVRQGTDATGAVASAWLFDPDGTLLEGPEGPVSHLVCGGVYDWSTGLIYRDGGYFDPMLGIWLAAVPLMVVIQGWQRIHKRKWSWLLNITSALLVVCISVTLIACSSDGWETLGGSVICTEVPEEFDPTHRESYDVTIVDQRGPTVHLPPSTNEGFFEWYVYFEVQRDGGESGYIIQEVNHNHRSWRKNGEIQAEAHPPLRYWEAWAVDTGKVHTQNRSNGVREWDDLFIHYGNPANSKGYNENTSIVRFYEGELPDHFASGGVSSYAGANMLASETVPNFWEYQGTAHTFRLDWDLTGDKKDWWWKYTVRRGDQRKSESWGNVNAAIQESIAP